LTPKEILADPAVNLLLIFLSKVALLVFGYRSFEHYLRGHAWTTSTLDTIFFAVAIWSQRIVVAEKSNPALFAAMCGIFVGTFIAAKLRKTTDKPLT